jgi:hypothetical protein
MQEPHKKGIANHLDPESCAGVGKRMGEALTGPHAGQPSSSGGFAGPALKLAIKRRLRGTREERDSVRHTFPARSRGRAGRVHRMPEPGPRCQVHFWAPATSRASPEDREYFSLYRGLRPQIILALRSSVRITRKENHRRPERRRVNERGEEDG